MNIIKSKRVKVVQCWHDGLVFTVMGTLKCKESKKRVTFEADMSVVAIPGFLNANKFHGEYAKGVFHVYDWE